MLKVYMKKRERMIPYLFILPTVLITVTFLFYPLVLVFSDSFYNFQGLSKVTREFIGVENYKTLVHDPIFWESIVHSIVWVVSTVAVESIIGLILALLLNNSFYGRNVLRTIFISPYAISGILTSSMFFLIYNQNTGVLNDILKRLGIISNNIAWLGNTKTAFGSVVLAEAWRGIPFFIIILTAALQTIPLDLYDAAKVDGAGSFKILTAITLPQLMKPLLFACGLRAVWEFNNIDVIYSLTLGGPGTQTTTTAMYLVRTAIKGSNFGYGATIAVGIFILYGVIGFLCFGVRALLIKKGDGPE